MEEWMANAEAIRADPRWREAIRRRGATDLSLVQIEPWPASNFGLDVDRSGRRIERRAVGDFPNQHPGGAGLPARVAADRPLVDADVVAWLTVGTSRRSAPSCRCVAQWCHAGGWRGPIDAGVD
jgi:Cu2+-containing amine oxidase